MSMLSLNRDPSVRELRLFAALGAVLLLALSLWIHMTRDAAMTSSSLRFTAIGLVLVALLAPRLLKPIYRLWMLAVYPLGWIVGNAVLAIVYFGVLTPVGCILRLLGHDPLQTQSDALTKSYWHRRSRERSVSDYFRQY